MKDIYTTILKEIFSKHIKTTRKQFLNVSQEKMAEYLLISQNNYSHLETQKSCCSGLTLAIYLSVCCEDTESIIAEIKDAFMKASLGEIELKEPEK